MQAIVQFKLTVQEADVLGEAVQAYRRLQVFSMKAVAATEEEKRGAMGRFLQCEAILRALGYEPVADEPTEPAPV